MRGRANATSHSAARGARFFLLLASLTCACGGGDDGDQGGAAGAGPTPGMGQLCTSECTSGLVCESSGPFAGQCTAGCGSGAACQLLSGSSTCFNMDGMWCGLMCTLDAQCPIGTTCQTIGGMQGCRVAPVPTMP